MNQMVLLILIIMISGMILSACGAETQEGTTTGYGQMIPAGGGLVQSFVDVELDDGSEVRVWLTQDDNLWRRMNTGASQGIRIEFKRENDYWMFTDYVNEN